MDQEKIKELASDYSLKRQRFDALGQANTYGLTAEEQRKLDVAYALADAEYREAQRKLEAAKGPRC